MSKAAGKANAEYMPSNHEVSEYDSQGTVDSDENAAPPRNVDHQTKRGHPKTQARSQSAPPPLSKGYTLTALVDLERLRLQAYQAVTERYRVIMGHQAEQIHLHSQSQVDASIVNANDQIAVHHRWKAFAISRQYMNAQDEYLLAEDCPYSMDLNLFAVDLRHFPPSL
ncbi:hypothetical protein AcW2_005355 [Taiwanofungus camphoratus]|nr:hypothetical protein AcW2_005355 [Antrodia cinnamomea]